MRVSIPIGPICQAENQYRPIYMIQVIIHATTIIIVLGRGNTGKCMRVIINDRET